MNCATTWTGQIRLADHPELRLCICHYCGRRMDPHQSPDGYSFFKANQVFENVATGEIRLYHIKCKKRALGGEQ